MLDTARRVVSEHRAAGPRALPPGRPAAWPGVSRAIRTSGIEFCQNGCYLRLRLTKATVRVGCGATHVLLPARLLLRRMDEAPVIGAALAAAAGGRGTAGSRQS